MKNENLPRYYLGDTQEDAENTFKEFSIILNKLAVSYATYSGLDKEDLFSEALFGLSEAKLKFDKERSDNFYSYAIFKIKTALSEYCRKNKKIVVIPLYIRIASNYINKIKGILEKYESHDTSRYTVAKALSGKINSLHVDDIKAINNLHSKLIKLSKNSGVNELDLIDRSEFVPTTFVINDEYPYLDLYDEEAKQLMTALVVSKLKSLMTTEERNIADSIMNGLTYEEIGNKQFPKRSSSWVKYKIANMKNRLRSKLNPEELNT